MPIDLSQVRGRTDAQDQRFTRTDTILPTRRVQDAPEVQVDANIRNGERGDPQVQELKQTLGIMDDAQSSLVNLQQAQQANTERQNAQIAAGDSVTGQVNPDLYQKSEAYRIVIANGRADAAAAQAEAEAKTTAMNLVAQGATADPTKGDKVVGLEDVNQAIEQTFKSHVLDAQGQPIDFGDKSANVRLYQTLQQVREHVLGVAAENIQAQEQAKASTAVSSSIQAGLLKGDSSAVETGIGTLSGLGINMQQAKDTALHAVLDAALSSKNVDVIDRALSSTRTDGSPTWSAQEQNTLQTARHTYANEFEADAAREAERTSLDTLGNMALNAAKSGTRITPDVVQNLVNTGQIAPRYADTALGLQFKFDQQANERTQWGRTATLQGMEIARGGLELKNAQARDKAVGIFADAMANGMNGAQLQGRLISAMAHDPTIDSQTFVDAMELAKSVPPDSTLVTQFHAASHLYELNDALTELGNARQVREKHGQRVPTESQFAQTRDRAYFSFFQNLRKGMSNDDALRSALMGTGAMSAAQANAKVNAAVAWMTANPMSATKEENGKMVSRPVGPPVGIMGAGLF